MVAKIATPAKRARTPKGSKEVAKAGKPTKKGATDENAKTPEKVTRKSASAKSQQIASPKTTPTTNGTRSNKKRAVQKSSPKKDVKTPASTGKRRGRPPKATKEQVTKESPKQNSVVKKNAEKLEEYSCPNCPRIFSSTRGLKRHMHTCKSVKDEICQTDKSPPSSTEASFSVVPVQPEEMEVENIPYESSINLTCYCCGEDITTCHTVGDHMCNECGKLFTAETALQRHKTTMHAELPDSSKKVNDGSANEEIIPELKDKPRINCFCCGEDLLTAHISGDFECAQCSKRFKMKNSLERHLTVIHGSGNEGGIHECLQCGAKCPDKGTLARHMYTHTGLKPYSCPVCRQEFSRKYHLVRHNMQTGCDGSKKPVFPCQVCGREFNRKDNLREHLRAHAGQTKKKKMFSCDTCGMEFPGTNLLQVHKRTHTGDKPYWCDFCPKKFPSSGSLKKHRRTHTGERPYECQMCQKRFAAKETLNRHIRIHTGYKPHCCQYCGKRFIQSSQLKSHLFYHTGQSVLQPVEPIECEICGKKFMRRARLNEHTKFVHLGAKPFECHHCPKTFIRKEDLNRHLIIHSGVKAHKCPICEKAFAMKSSLKVHLLTHTKEQPRSCDECGRAFIRQDCLLRHMRNKHRDMLENIMSEAEKKKLQQQLIQMAAEANQLEDLEGKRELTEDALAESVSELLTLLVDEVTLRGLGWPQASIHQLLEAVIRRCGHEPASAAEPGGTPTPEQLRHNVKLLFTVVIDDSAVKALLNNQTVDEVILHVLRLAKS